MTDITFLGVATTAEADSFANGEVSFLTYGLVGAGTETLSRLHRAEEGEGRQRH